MAVLFWLVMLTFASGLWALTLLLFLLSRRSKSQISRWAGAVPLVVLTWGGVLAGGALGWMLISQQNPHTIWQQEFDFEPPADVQNLKGSFSAYGDNVTTYLQFQSSASTIKRIVQAGKLRLIPPQNRRFAMPVPNTDAPSWWKPKSSPTLQIWDRPSKNHFANESTVLCFDPKTGWAHYSFDGFD